MANRPGQGTLNFIAHCLGWVDFAYIFATLFTYAWIDVNRKLSAGIYVMLFILLAYYGLLGLIQFFQYMGVGFLEQPYRLDFIYLVIHTVGMLAVSWIIFGVFIGGPSS